MKEKIKVSIIVPIYNVEEYLRECLDSLSRQTLKEIEVIMVNDGSTDSSEAIAQEYDEKYNNFYLINKENGGLGQARNYGIPYVKGEYVAFVDSDDIVSEDAYEKMYNIAKKTSNDIVIGNVKRFNSKGIFASGLHKKVFKEYIEDAHITRNPELINDTTSWNKIYKTAFWKENDFKFPEGVLYEDIPVTIPAHFKANGVSVLEDTVYFWRVRDGINKSITQNRTEIKNFLDRLYVMNLVNEFYDDNVTSEDSYYARNFKWLDVDLKLYIDELLNADSEYIEILVKEISNYLRIIPQDVKDDLKAIDKIKYYFIERHDIESLLEVIKYQKSDYKKLKVYKKGDQFIGDFPFRDIPDKYFNMTRELQLAKENKKIQKIYWENNVMNIEGFMYLAKVNIKSKSDVQMKAQLINTSNNESVEVDIINTLCKSTTQRSGIKTDTLKLNNRIYNYDWSGYKLVIDFNDDKIKKLGSGKYKILIQYTANGIHKEFYLGEPVKGSKARPKPYVANLNKITCQYNLGYELILSMYEEAAVIEEIKIDKEGVIFRGNQLRKNKIILINWDTGSKINFDYKIDSEKDNQTKFSLEVPFYELEKYSKEGEWYLYYINNGKREPLSTNCLNNISYLVRNNNLIKINISSAGTIFIKYEKLRTYVESIKWEEKKLILVTAIGKQYFGSVEKLDSASISFIGESSKNKVILQTVSSYIEDNIVKHHFEVDFSDSTIYEQFISDIWLAQITYSVNNKKISHLVLSENQNYRTKIEQLRHKINPFTTKKGYLALNVSLKWKWFEKGPRRREAIERYIYPMFRKLPINNKKIVFEGWWGQKYHCNPRYLYEYINENYPDYKCIWSLNDENIKIKGNAKKVRKNSLAYHYHMATSKFFVNNVNFADSYVKREGTIEVQTMHGTPLKTLGLDVVDEFPTQDHVDRFLRRCARWNYLVVQSDAVSKITDSCYAYEKDYLKTGYPRNDVLFQKNNEEDIKRIKKKLNIPLDKKVILYTPTWRIKDKFDFQFEVSKLKKSLGKDYVFLTRIHPFAVKGFNKNLLDEFIMDFSEYESVEELYLVSDILITDYSSVMFDYAILNRPILFYTYDLELYRDNLRGFNLDFEKEAPGPLLKTSDQVINAIVNIEKVKIKNKKKFRKFRRKYCQYEKGNACETIFNKVFINK